MKLIKINKVFIICFKNIMMKTSYYGLVFYYSGEEGLNDE